MPKKQQNRIQRPAVVVTHVAAPDAAERLCRAYSLIIQAAKRLVQPDAKSGESSTQEEGTTDNPTAKK